MSWSSGNSDTLTVFKCDGCSHKLVIDNAIASAKFPSPTPWGSYMAAMVACGWCVLTLNSVSRSPDYLCPKCVTRPEWEKDYVVEKVGPTLDASVANMPAPPADLKARELILEEPQ